MHSYKPAAICVLQMEIAFFDTSKTGEITSRLSADTSTVSDQVRSYVQLFVSLLPLIFANPQLWV